MEPMYNQLRSESTVALLAGLARCQMLQGVYVNFLAQMPGVEKDSPDTQGAGWPLGHSQSIAFAWPQCQGQTAAQFLARPKFVLQLPKLPKYSVTSQQFLTARHPQWASLAHTVTPLRDGSTQQVVKPSPDPRKNIQQSQSAVCPQLLVLSLIALLRSAAFCCVLSRGRQFVCAQNAQVACSSCCSPPHASLTPRASRTPVFMCVQEDEQMGVNQTQ